MRISIIIPTHNRAEIVRKTLQAYGSQNTAPEILELLLVDDGSQDHTEKVVAEFVANYPVPLRYLRQERKGPSAARNYGIREARGNIILFGDDDIIPAPRLVAEHAAWHRKHPEENIGVLGYVEFASEVNPTPFMKWINAYGPQFSYAYLKPGDVVEYRCAGFWNTSLKTEFLRRNGIFDEAFRGYGWEDVELSYRLHQRGYRALYNAAAVGYHHKFEKFGNTLSRTKAAWDSFPSFARTEAGQNYTALLTEYWASSEKPVTASRKLARLLKPIVMPALRPLLDTRVPLPRRLYDAVWYHYSHPIIDRAVRSAEAVLVPAGVSELCP